MVAPTPNYREAGQLLCAYGRRLGAEGDDAGAQQALGIAMAIAKHEEDLTLEVTTLLNAAWVDLEHLRLQESGEKGHQVMELIERLNDSIPSNESIQFGMGAQFVLRVCYNTGQLTKARRYAAIYQEVMEIHGDPGRRASAASGNAKIAALSGDWTSARQYCDRGLVIEPRNIWLLQIRALLEYATGDFDLGAAFLERQIEIYRLAGPEPGYLHVNLLQTIGAIAHMDGMTKHIDIAQSIAAAVLSSHRICPDLVWLTRSSLALIAAHRGESATVEEQFRALHGQRGALMTMDVDRVLGIVAAASGEWDEATAYFEAALATWKKGHYPQYAWSAYEYADMLLKRGNSGYRDRAKQLLDEALSISRELGMVPLTERVQLRKQSVNTQ